jgi:4-amino-4-deoxy-L-arabinose transferase-like glycosyltransferase
MKPIEMGTTAGGVWPATGRRRWTLGLPLVAGLIARVLYWTLATPAWIPSSDSHQYIEIARNVAAGDGFSLIFPELSLHATAFRPPLYPLLLALPSAMLGDEVLWPARLLSLLLSLGVISLTVSFVRRFAGPVAAISAGMCVALYPPLIANDTIALSEPLGLLLLLAMLIALDRRQPLLMGSLLGLLLLTRPNAYAVVIIAVVFLWSYVGWRRALAGLGICLLVVAPWLIRNHAELDTIRLTTSDGFTLAAIYSPQAQANEGFVDPVFSERFDSDRALRLSQFAEGEWNTRLTTIGLDGIRSNPAYVVRMVGHNVTRYFELTPAANEGAERLDGRNLTVRRWTLPLFYLVTGLGLVGLWSARRIPTLWPISLIVAQFVVLSLLLVSPPRLRAPFDLLMCIGVGLFVEKWVSVRRARGGSAASDETTAEPSTVGPDAQRGAGSRGSPSMRSAMMLRRMFVVPPMIV